MGNIFFEHGHESPFSPKIILIRRGWPVDASTLLQSQPSGSIFFRWLVARAIGTWVNWWFQRPTTMFGPAAHAGMHGVLAQQQAEGRVVGVGRLAADDVAGVDVLEVALRPATAEMPLDGVTQEDADVAELGVARGIALRRWPPAAPGRPLRPPRPPRGRAAAAAPPGSAVSRRG